MAADRMVVAVRRGNSIHVFSFNEKSELWVLMGNPIEIQFNIHDSDYDYYRLALSSDGDVLAISDIGYDINKGRVKIFVLNSYTGWAQVGNDIFGKASFDYFGFSLDISADGSTLAIGAIYNSNSGGFEAGQVKVYKYNKKNGSWVQKGQDLNGEAEYDTSGWSLAMSRDGNLLAIGAPWNDDNGYRSGHVRIHQFIYGNDAWFQLGGDINGKESYDMSGHSVAMSGDGLTLAIGAPRNGGGGLDLEHVRVYKYNQTSLNWVQLGNDIDGGAAGDYSGWSVDMSNDGTTVVIGATKADRSGAYDVGQVRIYRFVTTMEDWAQVGGDIHGDVSDAELGYDVSMSGDSTMIGAMGKNTTALKLFKRNTCDPTHSPSFMPTSTFTNVSLHLIITEFPRYVDFIYQYEPILTSPFLQFFSIECFCSVVRRRKTNSPNQNYDRPIPPRDNMVSKELK
jgi:hypothetical protein